jgi:peptidyl-prolyl cis-trans isomerase B (cyclophilin B)
MTMRMLVAELLAGAVVAVIATCAGAATLAPVKGYAKVDEPVAVRLLNENEAGKKALEKVGLAATELEGMFTPATEVAGLEVYTFDGKKLERKGEPAVKGDGSVDISAAYPEVKKAGTYVVVWKDAMPLVIETLRSPAPWGALMDETRVSKDQRATYIKRMETEDPVVTHIVPLEYGVITTDRGVIKVKFAYDVAPRTVDNFISLAKQKFYDGTVFHRVISGFMIQGGDALGTTADRAGTGGPGYQVDAEFSNKAHERGTLSMARSGIDTAGSQFFIVHQKSAHLDGSYTAFGDAISGLEVVDEIAKTPSEKGSGAVKGVKPKIESLRILPGTAEMYGIGGK